MSGWKSVGVFVQLSVIPTVFQQCYLLLLLYFGQISDDDDDDDE